MTESITDDIRPIVRGMLINTCLEHVEHFETRYERAKQQYETREDSARHSRDYQADQIAHIMLMYGYKSIFD